MRRLLFVVPALVVAFGSVEAFATDCGGPAPVVASTTPSQSSVVTPETSRQMASATAGLISDRVATVAMGLGAAISAPQANTDCVSFRQGGVNFDDTPVMVAAVAGDIPGIAAASAKPNSVWTGASATRVTKSDVGGEYHGAVKNAVVGYDRRVGAKAIAGLAIGYENVDIKTTFNDGTFKGNSVSVAPYVGYAFNNWLSADASIGYTLISYDFMRNTNTVTGKTNATRVFGATNLTAQQRYGATKVKASLGYLRVHEDQNAYTETDGTKIDAAQVNFGQIRLTTGVGHDINTAIGTVTPNAFSRFEYDTPHSAAISLGNGLVSSNDRFGVTFGLGVDVAVSKDTTLELAATTTEFRTNTDIYGIQANLRYRF